MGRWAEVYFTSPPEKREEAVLDLLRELQARSSAQSALLEARQVPAGTEPELRSSDLRNVTMQRLVEKQRCNNCGQDNPPRHQFCGMCGARLGSPASEDYHATEGIYRSPGVESQHPLNSLYTEPRDLDSDPVVDESVVTTEDPGRNPYDLSLFQTLREEGPADFDYAPSPSVRYRYLIGAILAVLIAVLGYMAWRGGLANQDAQSTSPPPTPAATENPPAPASQNTAGSAPSNQPNAEPQAAPAEKKVAEPTGAKPAEGPEHSQTKTAEHAAVPTPAPSASAGRGGLEQQSFETSGADDFAMAQRYLTGATGRGRDGAEAAKWLWKAMGKHYGPAMVALADLYLKGDGVSKNCDQARVLLDSAALRGVAGAGQRLRNLQAFGCQ